MKIALSLKVIKTNIQALEACRCYDASAAPSRILMPGADSIITAAVRQVFAEAVLRLYPYVESSSLNSETATAYTATAVQPDDGGETAAPAGENPAPEREMLTVDLRLPRELEPEEAWILRRNLENAVSHGTLALLARSSAAAGALKAAEAYDKAASRFIDYLEEAFRPLTRPTLVRTGWW